MASPPSAADRRQQVEGALDSTPATSSEQQREALQAALAQTGAQLFGTADGQPGGDSVQACAAAAAAAAETDDGAWWLAARLRTLQHLERLDTVLALHGGTWNAAAFVALRDCTVGEAASALASAARLAALGTLLQRHPRALAASVLDALACIPETLDPKQCAPLLRQVVALQEGATPPLSRAADATESALMASALRASGQYALLLATEPMCEASSGWHPPTQRQLAAWACERAQQLDAATGQLTHAVALLEAARSALRHSEPSLGVLQGAAQDLLSLVKLASARGADDAWRTDLRRYAGMPPQQRLSLLLSLLSADSLAEDLPDLLAPFLARLDSVGLGSGGGGDSEPEAAADSQLVLRRALEQEAARRLPWVVKLVQCEARLRCVFAGAAQLATAAAACCYASTASDAWELQTSLLNAAQGAVEAAEEDGEESAEELRAASAALQAARGHVSAARLLTKHGLTTSASAVRDSDRAAALRLVRTLLARLARTRNTESRWVQLWMDLRSITEHGFEQLSEDDVRSELCRSLLRAGQYRLCRSYLEGLPSDAAEQLVLSAAKDIYLGAAAMGDSAVQQAKECLALLPASAAARKQLAAISRAEELRELGLDLPPLQLQQLQEQAASGDAAVLQRLLAEHPGLLAADSSALGRLAAALGLERQQEPLLLRAAEAAHAAGNRQGAQNLLSTLAAQHYKPAWRLAAALAPSCSADVRGRLVTFALASAPCEQLLPLLLQWEAAERSAGVSCWDLFSAADLPAASSSAGDPAEQQRQWLEAQLRPCLAGLDGGATSSDGEAAALGCLLALGLRGLRLWEELLSEQGQAPLSQRQRRRALLLGLTASTLLALQPADLDSSAAAAAVTAAEARLAASPAELLRLAVQQREQQLEAGQQQQQEPGLRPGSSADLSSALAEGDGSTASGTPVGRSASGTPRVLVVAAANAKAATAAAGRFRGLLMAAADAQQLQQLLPGVDAAAALAGGSQSRRRLVLQLAAAAGKPPSPSLPAAVSLGAGASGDSSRPSTAASNSSAGGQADSSRRRGMLLRRASSRKKVEEGTEDSAGQPRGTSPTRSGRQLGAPAVHEMLEQALQLARKCGVPAWEVHLAFLQSLLLHNQQHWQAATAAPLLQASLPPLLAGPQQAAALARALLLEVWPAAASRRAQYLAALLQLLQRCCGALAAVPGGAAEPWQALAAACQAAEQLAEAASGIDAKLFLQPIVQLAVAALPPVVDSSGDGQAAVEQAPAADAAALAQQLLQHASSETAPVLASAVQQLARQHGVAAAAAAQHSAADAYPCSGSTVFLAAFCSRAAEQLAGPGRPDVAALQLCVQRMAPAHAVAAVSFAVAGGPCPLPLPAGAPALPALALPADLKKQLLAAALAALDSEEAMQALAADAALLQQVQQQRQLHALLAASSSVAAAMPGATQTQQAAMRDAAQALQQAALAGTDGSGALHSCLQHLLTTGCRAGSALRAAAVLQALQRQPQQAPPAADALLVEPDAAVAAVQALSAAAEAATTAALQAMSGGSGEGEGDGAPQLSPGDAVQNLFALLRSLHTEPGARDATAAADDSSSAAASDAVAAAVDVLRLLVWSLLQQRAASYDGSGGAAQTEAHLQVLELLGSVGSSSMWPGWQLPADALGGAGGAGAAGDAGGGFKHQQALLFTRTAAALAVEWPAAVQQCRLSAADFGDAAAAEAALLRLAAAATEAEQLRLLLRLLAEVLTDEALPPAPETDEDSPAEGDGEASAAAAAAAAAAGPPTAALHRAWATCLRMLLPLGDLPGVLAALDERRAAAQQAQQVEAAPLPALLMQAEAEALLETADATHGAAAAAALALLLPFASLQRSRWQQLLHACDGSASASHLAASLPGLSALLLLLAAHTPELLVRLASGGWQQASAFQKLVGAALLQQQEAGAEGGAYAHAWGGGLTLRAAVAASAAAQLAAARQYAAAGWVAMEACSTPRLLRVLDSGPRVLQRLLRGLAARGDAAASAAAGLAAGAPGVPVPAAAHTAAALVAALPGQCSAVLEGLKSDLQLA